LLKSPQVNFLHSWHWGQFNLKLNHQIHRLGFYQDNKIIGLSLLIKIKAKRGTFFECPGGPVINWDNKNQVKEVIRLLKNFAIEHKVNFIRIRPNILSNLDNLNLVNSLDFKKAPMHLHAETTWVLNLDQSEEELLGNMRKNTRYSIKKAQKLGVKITKSTDIKDVNSLYNLQLETVKRKRFVPFSLSYLTKQLEIFQKNHSIQLFKAEYKGKLLAISFIIFYGDEAVYHYSGSSNQQRHIPASYLLQWEAIKEAKKRHLKRYNFWGYTDNPKHRFFGPSLFKKGFGGFQLDYLPAHDLPLNNRYWFTYIIEAFRRKLRHL